MAYFQSSRFDNRRDESSKRLRVERGKIQKVYDDTFVTTSINGKWGHEKLTCILKFSILEVDCKAKIVYDGANPPQCWLIYPTFEDPQHIYKDKGNLCLYDPKNNEWTKNSHLYNTFIPWCMEWVVFQMLYEQTGEWQHPGRHPGVMSDLELRDFCSKHGIPFNEEIKKILTGA